MVAGEIRKALLSMPKEQWFTLEEIFEYIEGNMILTEDDMEIPEGKYEPRWKVHTRTILHNIKKEGYVVHEYRITKGEITNKTIPAIYMFCENINLDITIRHNNKTKYFEALLSMPKEQWFTLEEIFEYIEGLDIINDEEYERSKPDNPMPIWKHRIYTTLGHMKNRGYAEHKKAVAKVNSPTGKKIPAMYKFI